MTGSERERRIEAGMRWLGDGDAWPKDRGIVAGILDAADEAVPVVSEAEMQRRSRIDHEAAEREHVRAERAEAAARDFAKELTRLLNRDRHGYLRTANVLACHSSFSGEGKPKIS